jgi:archaellum component FlaC
MVDMAGNSARFNTTGSNELARMTLGYELTGLLLNYALASHQKAELSIAKDKEVLVKKNLAALEKDVKVAKEKCGGDLKTLREKNVEEIANLTKKHEEELEAAKRDRESAFKTMSTVQASFNAKDERIKALAKENEAALAELATLKQEKAKWGSDKDNLEAAIREQYEQGFQFALEQVKALFPGIDEDVLGKADAMSIIEGDKLVPHAPVEMVQDSPANESPTKEPPAQESPAQE